MRWLLITLLSLPVLGCERQVKLPQGAQPYLIVRVTMPKSGIVAGTVAQDIRFDYSDRSKDGRNSVEMHASLIEKTPAGFRFLWQSVYRTDAREVANISEEEFAPWGRETKLSARGNYTVGAFYASKPANELFHR